MGSLSEGYLHLRFGDLFLAGHIFGGAYYKNLMVSSQNYKQKHFEKAMLWRSNASLTKVICKCCHVCFPKCK